jgi:hypothetical protein
MPITYDIDRSSDLTTFVLSGEVRLTDFIDTLNAYGKSGPTKFELYDARSIDGKRLTFDEMSAFADYLAKHAEIRPLGSKTAVVVTESIDFGLSRMISILTEETTDYQIEAFRDRDEALGWLGLPEAS